MSMAESIRYVRRLAVEGRHLHGCMAAPQLREQGWKMMWRARRIARRLGYSLMAMGIDL